jgi:hypothetical protein
MNKLMGIMMVLAAWGSAWAGAQEDDLVRLAQAGVDSSVLSAFVGAAKGPFHLSVDQIIDLNSLGVPSGVISDALRHAPSGITRSTMSGASAPDVNSSQASAAATDSAALAYPAPAAVAPAPDAVIYPDPYYYDYWPYAGVGWGWGPGWYGWGSAGHNYYRGYNRGYGHGAPGYYRSAGVAVRASAGITRSASVGGSRGGGGHGGGRR